MRLYTCDAAGVYAPATDTTVLAAARCAAERKLKRGVRFDGSAAARRVLPGLLGTLEHEVFCVAYLDNRHRLIEFQEMFRGTIAGASVHSREVVKEALRLNAAAVVFAHNHPSGVCEPSQADEMITRTLRDALALVDVRVIDHCIVAGNDVLSMAERGLI